MKMNKNTNELLQRYLLAVKRELGGKQREDITAEIESYIYDLLEERYAGKEEVTQAELEVILKEMGAPRKVASQYAPQRYLIGPRLFPVYWLVLRILAAVVAGALTLSTVIATVINPPVYIGPAVLELLGTIWSGVLSAAGAVTLAFAIIERATEGKRIDEIEELKEFKLSDLPELPEEEKSINLVGTSFECVLSALGMIFFIYIQSTDGFLPVFMNTGENMRMVRLFTDNFLKFIPVILMLAGLDIARNITLMVQGRHSSLTNWWHIASEGANVILNGLMISALPLITLAFFNEFIHISDIARTESLANTGLAAALGLGILGSIVDIIKRATKEIRNPAY
jgi:hypothetical protein